jgi:hypothetical protein
MWQKENDWFWEGNIQDKISAHLQKQDFTVKTADTRKKTTGADIIGTKSNAGIIVEVEGWPSDKYAGGIKQGQPKPSRPAFQAKHWLSEIFPAIVRRKLKYPNHVPAIGLPEHKRYLDLLNELRWATEKLGIKAFIAKENGQVVEK